MWQRFKINIERAKIQTNVTCYRFPSTLNECRVPNIIENNKVDSAIPVLLSFEIYNIISSTIILMYYMRD